MLSYESIAKILISHLININGISLIQYKREREGVNFVDKAKGYIEILLY